MKASERVRVLGATENTIRELREGVIWLPIVRLGPHSTVTLNGSVSPRPAWVGEFKVEFVASELRIAPEWLDHVILEEIRTEDNYDASKSNQVISMPDIKIDTWHRTLPEIEKYVQMWHGQFESENDDQLRLRAARPERCAALSVRFVMTEHTLVHCRFRNPTNEERVASAIFMGTLSIDKPDGYSIDPRHDRSTSRQVA